MRRGLAVGDIHGRFDLLQQRLDQLDFDPEQDVAILLGDLVDRSDGSLDALEWCARPGILRVRGNHEQITAIAASDPDSIDYHRRCGGHWRSEEHTYELQSLMRISYAVFCLKKKK